MYVVRVGYYAWLGEHAGRLCVTTSGAHAARYPGNFPAAHAAAAFSGDRGPALANSVLTRRLLAYLRSAPVAAVPLAEHEARGALVADGLRAGTEPHPAPAAGSRSSLPAPGHPVAEKAARAAGVTRQVYQWTLDHPQATKADALAAFPGANPGTVGVQFGAARRAAAA